MSDVVMPRLSDSMEEGTILVWMVSPGDEVEVGQEIAEIETDKANMAYEADLAGTVTEILVAEGETAAVGAPIARIGDPSEGGGTDGQGRSAGAAGPVAAGDPSPAVAEASSGTGSAAAPPPTAASETDEGAPAANQGAGEGGGERVKASPLARRLAKERGVEISSLSGSGPGGRIVKADVEEAPRDASQTPEGAPAAPPSSPPSGETAKGEVTVREPSRAQQVIARRMAESKATAPHFYLTTEIEMSKAVEARRAIKAAAKEGDVVPSFNDMVVKACAIVLREQPKANGAYRDGRFELYSRVNVGVAVAAEGGLVVPTVFDADRRGLREIAAEARALARKVREGTITPPELSGATFTVSNLGMFGIEAFDAVINSPQAAILAVGAIREAPVVRGGEIVPGHLMKVTLSCDHRILYGAEGAEFLARVRALLEEPVGLAL